MEQFAKINDDGTITTTCAPDNVSEEALSKTQSKFLEDGFLPHVTDEPPSDILGEFQQLEARHRNDGDKITTYYEVVSNDPMLIQQKIDELTAQLSASDYKVVKNHEYIDAGGEPYYDPVDLYNEREPIRVQIRELEILIKEPNEAKED